MFNFSWTNKKDGDDIYAEHVNSLADGIKETQEAVEGISNKPDIVIDDLMNGNSTNPVQNNIIVGFVNNKSNKATASANEYTDNEIASINTKLDTKADKPTITISADTVLSFEFSANHNIENRTGELTTLSFTFGDGEYAEDYISGLSFDSGETPTAIDYTDSGILNWVGTDCVTSGGLSIFQPSANTHYDIVFYFNGVQFIGLVNGFVPATGNEAV